MGVRVFKVWEFAGQCLTSAKNPIPLENQLKKIPQIYMLASLMGLRPGVSPDLCADTKSARRALFMSDVVGVSATTSATNMEDLVPFTH